MLRRFLFLLAASAAGIGILAPSVLHASIVGSPHDFSDSGPFDTAQTRANLTESGVCSACHIPHGAADNVLWPRDLGPYRTALALNGSGEPNYLHNPTISCYDCHDWHAGGGINNDPDVSWFSGGHKPQNILFGFDRDPNSGYPATITEDGYGNSSYDIPGFYENVPPYSDAGANYGANPSINLDNGDIVKTGGHYFKRFDPDSTGPFKKGDKLPCRDCHDPHESDGANGNWQAFIRKNNWPAGSMVATQLGTSFARASNYMANPTTTGSRDDDDSRILCAMCHGYSDAWDNVDISHINAAYSGGEAVRPPNTVSAHAYNGGNGPACVSCHSHNSVEASCTDCHGYPPPGYPTGKTPTAYPSGQDSHGRHVTTYKQICNVCHAGVGHDNTVQVQFDNTILGGRLLLGQDNNLAVPPGGTSCWNIYCHSSGRDGITPSGNPTHYKAVQWGVQTGQVRCNGCHGAFANDNVNGDFNADNTSRRYGAPNYLNSGAAGSATSNSHKAHVATYECYVCHDATLRNDASFPTVLAAIDCTGLHVNVARDILFAGPAAGGTFGAQKSCSVAACHGASSPKWGETITDCGACHVGAGDTEDYVFGSPYTRSVIDNTQWTTNGHGRSTGTYPGSGKPGANLACTACHDFAVAHDNASNPFRIRAAIDNGSGPVPVTLNQPDTICRACHPQTSVRAHTAADMTASGYTTLRTWNWTPRCVDCHDPHGDQSYWMIRDAINRQANQGTYGTASQASPNVANLPIDAKTDLDPSISKSAGVCDYCHVNTIHNLSGSGSDSQAHNEGSDCITCHAHQGGFFPSGCESCHGYPPYNALAPNVVTNSDNSFTYWTQSGHGRWADNASIAAQYRPKCDACHDVGNPSPSTHKDNVLNWAGANRNANTFHLKATVNGVPTLSATDNNQLTVDNFCWAACHASLPGTPAGNMRHTHDPGLEARFGRHGTYSDASGLKYPPNSSPSSAAYGKPADNVVYHDSALTTNAPTSGFWYAPCVACHDPHGTQAADTTGGSNLMMRGNWKRGNDFCAVCHK